MTSKDRESASAGAGRFAISLDFELLWGVRDHHDRDSYGRNVLGVREAIPRMLDLFAEFELHATWATVGMLLCETKDELIARRPALLPSYADERLSSYGYLPDVGADERTDPFYFGASLARTILSYPHQELGTHTFSHYYCLEPGQTVEQFAADLDAAMTLMRDRSFECRSIVFPRNQFGPEHLATCASAGLAVFRGTESAWCYASAPGASQGYLRRSIRLADAYVDLTGPNAFRPARVVCGLLDAPASRFLRPYARRLGMLEPLRLRRILGALDAAARRGETFHLWWHPHNFGVDLPENMSVLRRIAERFAQLRDRHGMRSVTMSELAFP